MTIEFHPDAAKNFNDKAATLVSELGEFPYKGKLSEQPGASSFKPEIYSRVVEPISVTEGSSVLINAQGQVYGFIVFKHDNKAIGLTSEGYKKYKALIEALHKSKTLSQVVSLDFLNTTACAWMKLSHLGQAQNSLTEYVISECEKCIEEVEIWIPIAQTYVEEDIVIGRVVIKTMSKKMFDDWRNQTTKYASANPLFDQQTLHNLEALLEEKRQKLQGLAAATMKLRVEAKRASEIAFEQSEKAVSLLRLFSPANLHPMITSHCALLGRENIQSYNYLAINSETRFSFTSGVLPSEFQDWNIDKNKIRTIRQQGLDDLSDLLNIDKRTSFQNSILDALTLYSRSCLMRELADKLVYILVPLESILLKDENEPIMQNIGERLALMIGNSVKERRDIISNVKAVYNLRSKFIHHGHKISSEETAVLGQFMFNAWRFFLLLVKNSNRFPDKTKAIEAIDNIKFSAGIISDGS